MSHLDRDLAAFVDGQLSPEDTARAQRHVADCGHCRGLVGEQHRLKVRLASGRAPAPPPTLLAALSSVPAVTAKEQDRWQRVRSSPVIGVGAALSGASLMVLVLAFLAGGHEIGNADLVQPAFDDYAQDFVVGPSSANGTMTTQALDDLDANGWPCAPSLGGGLKRVDGRWLGQSTQTVAITYTNGVERLRLYEFSGALDDPEREDFQLREIGGHRLWLRPGEPDMVTWDADGVVFVVVTDLDRDQLGQALSELPKPNEPRDPSDRVGDGFERMANWVKP